MLCRIAAIAALMALPAAAQAQRPGPPRLIVTIVVDQLSSQLFEQYRPHFTGGLARLANGGVLYPNGYQAHAATETCPGHATVLTGVHPARSGIIANSWLDLSRAPGKRSVYCVEGGSAKFLKVPTLGERLKAVAPLSRSVAVAGKDRSAIMLSGQAPDQRWFWDSRGFATDLKAAPQPPVIDAVNAAVARQIAAAQPPLDPPPVCASRAQPVPVTSSKSIGTGRFARSAGDAAAFRLSPEFDAATLAAAAALQRQMRLGQGPATDLLSISLSATDLIGHAFGNQGQEMCLQLLSLDRDLAGFFALLDSSGIDYLVALTADHGGADAPERERLQGNPAAARALADLTPEVMSTTLAARLRLKGPLLHGESPGGDIYLDRALSPRDRARALAAAVAAYRSHPQVEAVFTAAEAAATPLPTGRPDRWTLLQRLRASFDPQRSGDLLVVLKEKVTPLTSAASTVATHGTPWDHDRRVPILFWRRGMAPAVRPEPTATVDVMPTLGAMLGLALPAGEIDGQCLAAVAAGRCQRR